MSEKQKMPVQCLSVSTLIFSFPHVKLDPLRGLRYHLMDCLFKIFAVVLTGGDS